MRKITKPQIRELAKGDKVLIKAGNVEMEGFITEVTEMALYPKIMIQTVEGLKGFSRKSGKAYGTEHQIIKKL